MSNVEYNNVETGGVDVSGGIMPMSSNSRPLHRVRDVRQQQGVSLRSAARKLDLAVHEIRLQEDPRHDLKVSDLLRWQQVLEVPLSDLLIDNDAPLSEPVCKRASMLRVMKTARAIQDTAHDPSVRRMANMLVAQLVDMMPELEEVAAWHTVGQRRTQEEIGRIAERPISDNFFSDNSH